MPVRYVKTECATMGHENCKKVFVTHDGHEILIKTIHNVYGKTHIEKH